MRLAAADHVRIINVRDAVADLQGWRQIAATRFDSHPSALVHRRMAEALLGWLPEWWPELFRG